MILPADPASLERVCLHESAHEGVARALGACGFVRIVRLWNAVGEAARFAGSFQMHGALGEREWRVVALAGVVAEWMQEDPAIAVDTVVARLADGSALPPQDARLARGYDRDDVERCIALLREHWVLLLVESGERVAEIEASLETTLSRAGNPIA